MSETRFPDVISQKLMENFEKMQEMSEIDLWSQFSHRISSLICDFMFKNITPDEFRNYTS